MKLRYVSGDEFSARRNLLAGFDDFRRAVDSAGVERLDAAYRRAFDVLTSSTLVNAMDLEKEDQALRDRYGRGSPKHQGDGAPEWNDQLLMARRLVEAGARCVTVAYGFWIRTATISARSRNDCRCSIKESRPWSRIFTRGGLIVT